MLRHLVSEVGMRVQTGPDGGASDSELLDAREGGSDAGDGLIGLSGDLLRLFRFFEREFRQLAVLPTGERVEMTRGASVRRDYYRVETPGAVRDRRVHRLGLPGHHPRGIFQQPQGATAQPACGVRARTGVSREPCRQ